MSALPRHFLEVVRLIVPGDRMERRIAVFTAFMDESNSHFGAKWFVLGGFLGRATDWLSFEGHCSPLTKSAAMLGGTRCWATEVLFGAACCAAREAAALYQRADWAEFLDRHGLSHLHTTDLMGFREEFEDWDQGRRDKFVCQMAWSLRETAIAGWVCAVDQAAYRRTVATRPRKIHRDSIYGFCFQVVAARLLDQAAKVDPGPVSFVLERGHNNVGDAWRIMQVLRHIGPQRGWSVGNMAEAGKNDYGALQAADALVHFVGRNVDAIKSESGYTKEYSQLMFFSGGQTRIDIYDEHDLELLKMKCDEWANEMLVFGRRQPKGSEP